MSAHLGLPELVWWGAFFGIVAAVAVYHLLIYATLRTHDFASYGLYLVCLLGFELVRAPGLLPLGPLEREQSFWWTLAPLAGFGYWLFRSFLDLPARQPRLDRAFAIATALLAGAALLEPWLGARVGRLLDAFAFAILVLGCVAIGRAWRGGVRVARYFGLAYAGFFAGASAHAVWLVAGARLGALAPVADGGVELGILFQALTLALGLADRIAAANEERDRAQRRTIDEIGSLNRAYARFVPRAFLELLGKPDVRDVALGDGVEREMTVLFTDVRSFTALSEALGPGETFGFINALLARTGPVVREHGGIVDKFVGDAIMALFPGPADEALRAAIALQRAVRELNLERAATGAAPIAVGVGLHRGSLMLGTIGEPQRMDGTVIADAVNAAARIEGLTKAFGAGILISESVRAALDDPEAYALRYLGRVAVEGKQRGLGIYEAIDGDLAERRAAKLLSGERFSVAVRAFANGAFVVAAQAFEVLLGADPDDGAACYLQQRALDRALSGEPWEGVDRAAK